MTRRRRPNPTPHPPGPQSTLEKAYVENTHRTGWERHGWRQGSQPQRLLNALAGAVTIGDACALVKLDVDTEGRWRVKGERVLAGREPSPELAESLPVWDRVYLLWLLDFQSFSASAEAGPLATLSRAAQTQPRWATELLQIRWPGKYAKRRQVTGADGEPLAVEVRAQGALDALRELKAQRADADRGTEQQSES